MQKFLRRIAAISIGAGLAISAVSAHAQTITFEPLAGSSGSTATVLSQAGYDLVYAPGGGGFYQVGAPVACTPACASNGTNAFYSFNTGTLTISRTSGGVFSLSQFDAAQTFTTLGRSLNILVTGVTAGGPVSQTFTRASGAADVFSTFTTSSFTNLTSLTFTGVQPYPTSEFALDNVVLNATPGVPEPATWAMMIVGFGAIGGVVRRRAGAASGRPLAA